MTETLNGNRSIAPAVLLVEPDVVIRFPLAENLRECGYKVIECSSVQHAEHALAGDGLDIKAALFDASVDTEGVFVLAQWMHQHRPEISIMLAACAAAAVSRAEQLCLSATCVSKPYDVVKIVALIEEQRANP
jgi:DNA-binding NtrC family response regulator